jgi:uncharacterized membrane protein
VKKKKKAREQKSLWPLAAASAVPALLTALYFAFRNNAAFSLWVAQRVSRPYLTVMGKLTSPLSFSLMELLITLAILTVLVYIIYVIVRAVKNRPRSKILIRGLLTLIAAALWVFAWYAWSYGFDYYVPGFAERNGLDGGTVTAEKLYDVTKLFADEANRLAPGVERDENGLISADEEEIFTNSSGIYKQLETEFADLRGVGFSPKGMFYSRLFSRMGFTGVFFPFTGECNINTDAPISGRPFTIAHELAHSRGVTGEDEANFVGIAACMTCDDAMYRYSGCLSGLEYLLSDLYLADREAWREIRSGLSEYVRLDIAESDAYWNAMESHVTEAAGTVYTGYLKVGGDDRGIAAYDECVKLLVEYYSR